MIEHIIVYIQTVEAEFPTPSVVSPPILLACSEALESTYRNQFL